MGRLVELPVVRDGDGNSYGDGVGSNIGFGPWFRAIEFWKGLAARVFDSMSLDSPIA